MTKFYARLVFGKEGLKTKLIIVFLVGILVGFIFFRTHVRKKSIGELHIDNSDPCDGPYLFLELSKEPMTIKRNSYVTMKVVDIRFTQK